MKLYDAGASVVFNYDYPVCLLQQVAEAPLLIHAALPTLPALDIVNQ